LKKKILEIVGWIMRIHEEDSNDETCPWYEHTKRRYDQIKECLKKIRMRMDRIEMDHINREYLDIQVTKIHRLFKGMDVSCYVEKEQELLKQLGWSEEYNEYD